MAVIPESQLVLMRKRSQLNDYIKAGEWSKLLELEAELFTDIDTATQDPARSSRELLKELGKVVSTYRDLSSICQSFAQKNQQPK